MAMQRTSKEKDDNLAPRRTETGKYFLLELKARISDLEKMRNNVETIATERVGRLRQTDTYFRIPNGRLKLREVDGSDEVALIHYVREDIAEPKNSDVFIVRIQESLAICVKQLLEMALGVKAVIKKTRDVYYYEGTRIHLDVVENLGIFIEFEKNVSNTKSDMYESCNQLKKLMEKLGVDEGNLEKLSYCDIASH